MSALRFALSQHSKKLSLLALSGAFTVGVVVGRTDTFAQTKEPVKGAPTGQLCLPQFTVDTKQTLLPKTLAGIVGAAHVSEGAVQKGSRIGKGTAFVLVSPGSLEEAVEVLKACAAAGVAIIPQGANTGLTGGSVPRDNLCDRPTVVINMRRLKSVIPIGDGSKVLCMAGAGILDLKNDLEKIGRESHVILGSTFLNPSVAAGVAFGSGGTQIRKGPVYTEQALYLKVDADGKVHIVDQLGIKAKDHKELFAKLNSGKLTAEDMVDAPHNASYPGYRQHVCKLDDQVSRYNADTTGPDCVRSEGKVMILASIHDTYTMPQQTKTMWVACKDFAVAQQLKKAVYLANPDNLPSCVEYMDRDTCDIVDQAGRGMITTINQLGMGYLGTLWNLKLSIESIPLPLCPTICDLFLYYTNNLLPQPLHKPIHDLTQKYDHHLLVEMGEYGNGELQDMLRRFEEHVKTLPEGSIAWHSCNPDEANSAKYFRFVTAAAFRTYCVGKGLEGLSLDYSLPKNEMGAPPITYAEPVKRMRYSHFGCNVVHEDVAFTAGVDTLKAKYDIKHTIEGMKGKLPAEHGHGTEYKAPADVQERWKQMDPSNTMNPGVGGLPYTKHYA